MYSVFVVVAVLTANLIQAHGVLDATLPTAKDCSKYSSEIQHLHAFAAEANAAIDVPFCIPSLRLFDLLHALPEFHTH